MGARSTGSHSATTKADGHLLEYFRSDMDVGGGASNTQKQFSASGGTKTTDGSYTVHTFLASGYLVVEGPPSGKTG